MAMSGEARRNILAGAIGNVLEWYEVAPLEVRCTVISLGFNVTLGVVGGLSPLVAGWLVQQTGNVFCPAFMIMAAAPISVLALLRLKESYHDGLRTA